MRKCGRNNDKTSCHAEQNEGEMASALDCPGSSFQTRQFYACRASSCHFAAPKILQTSELSRKLKRLKSFFNDRVSASLALAQSQTGSRDSSIYFVDSNFGDSFQPDKI
ncbi:MAG: hypothetical protein HC767_09695 [Akkermansiaceae bacterium]|nr:hypothetical protein [Akkermansiaceae bacterium]